MIADLGEVRAELAQALADVAAKAYADVPASPIAPYVIVGWPNLLDWQNGGTLAGHSRVTLTLDVATPLADIDSGQRQMSTLLLAVRNALQSATYTTCRGVLVERATNVRPVEKGAALELHADLTVSFLA